MPAFSSLVSRRRFLRSSGLVALATLLAAHPTPAGAATPLRPHLAPDVSLDVKIGQMLLLGFRGTEVPDDSVIAHNVRDQHVGGIVLFGSNVQDKDQLRALTSRLQSLAQLPLLIGIDQEGGQVARLNKRRGYEDTLSMPNWGPTTTWKKRAGRPPTSPAGWPTAA